MTVRLLLLFTLCTVLPPKAGTCVADDPKRPNMIVIMADDM